MREIDNFYLEISNGDDYITTSYKNEIRLKYNYLYKKYKKIRYLFSYKAWKFKRDYRKIDDIIRLKNLNFIKKQMEKYKDFFSDINGKRLDDEQIKAVITDNDYNLIVAGAGSGKTLTMVAKVKYLIEIKKINPRDILCISFTNFTVNSLKESIKKVTNQNIDVYTFHKLGCEILKDNNIKINVCSDDALNRVINDFFENQILKEKEMLKKVNEYFLFYYNDWDNENYNSFDKITIKGERVKSYEEVYIANYLFKKGISYIYEKRYPYDSSDVRYRAYKPDFYLVDYDIYLEHFGIDEDSDVHWLEGAKKNKYLESIEWKRKIHKKNSTKLEETYSYYFAEGSIDYYLDEMIKRNKIEVCEISDVDIYKIICDKQKIAYLNNFKKLIATFINLFKANGYGISEFETFGVFDCKSNSFEHRKNYLFLNIVYRVYLEYQKYLKSNGEIDFNDMITEACKYVEMNGIDRKYKYIIIDEYQDTSFIRYKLIKSIIDKLKCKLIAIGDDFQSIYRFNGCDLNMFLDFGKYFGEYELLKLQNTYRNSQQLIDIAGKFVMKNPRQIKKKLRSNKNEDVPIYVYRYKNKEEIEKLISIIDCKELLVLGRNNSDINFFANNNNFKVYKNEIIYLKNKGMKIKYMTVHASKGLEAESVLIVNLVDDIIGFPNKIIDNKLLRYVNNYQVYYPYDEERRLFYVALTRTKTKVYLFTPIKNASIFVKELIKGNNIRIIR